VRVFCVGYRHVAVPSSDWCGGVPGIRRDRWDLHLPLFDLEQRDVLSGAAAKPSILNPHQRDVLSGAAAKPSILNPHQRDVPPGTATTNIRAFTPLTMNIRAFTPFIHENTCIHPFLNLEVTA
jgi:hypothetical protein